MKYEISGVGWEKLVAIVFFGQLIIPLFNSILMKGID